MAVVTSACGDSNRLRSRIVTVTGGADVTSVCLDDEKSWRRIVLVPGLADVTSVCLDCSRGNVQGLITLKRFPLELQWSLWLDQSFPWSYMILLDPTTLDRDRDWLPLWTWPFRQWGFNWDWSSGFNRAHRHLRFDRDHSWQFRLHWLSVHYRQKW